MPVVNEFPWDKQKIEEQEATIVELKKRDAGRG